MPPLSPITWKWNEQENKWSVILEHPDLLLIITELWFISSAKYLGRQNLYLKFFNSMGFKNVFLKLSLFLSEVKIYWLYH